VCAPVGSVDSDKVVADVLTSTVQSNGLSSVDDAVRGGGWCGGIAGGEVLQCLTESGQIEGVSGAALRETQPGRSNAGLAREVDSVLDNVGGIVVDWVQLSVDPDNISSDDCRVSLLGERSIGGEVDDLVTDRITWVSSSS